MATHILLLLLRKPSVKRTVHKLIIICWKEEYIKWKIGSTRLKRVCSVERETICYVRWRRIEQHLKTKCTTNDDDSYIHMYNSYKLAAISTILQFHIPAQPQPLLPPCPIRIPVTLKLNSTSTSYSEHEWLTHVSHKYIKSGKGYISGYKFHFKKNVMFRMIIVILLQTQSSSSLSSS